METRSLKDLDEEIARYSVALRVAFERGGVNTTPLFTWPYLRRGP
jgi:hypothetical protein